MSAAVMRVVLAAMQNRHPRFRIKLVLTGFVVNEYGEVIGRAGSVTGAAELVDKAWTYTPH